MTMKCPMIRYARPDKNRRNTLQQDGDKGQGPCWLCGTPPEKSSGMACEGMTLAWRRHSALQDSGYNVHRWYCVPADNTQPSRSKGNVFSLVVVPKGSLGNTSFLRLWPYFLPTLGSWLLELGPCSNSHNDSEILVVTKYVALLWLQGSNEGDRS